MTSPHSHTPNSSNTPLTFCAPFFAHVFPSHPSLYGNPSIVRAHSRPFLGHLSKSLILLAHTPHTHPTLHTFSPPLTCFPHPSPSPQIRECTLPHASLAISTSVSLQHHIFGARGGGSRTSSMTCVPYPPTVSEPPAPAFSWPWWYVLLGAVVAAGCVLILALFLVHRRKKETRYG